MTDHPDYKYRPRKRLHPKRADVRPFKKTAATTTKTTTTQQQQQQQQKMKTKQKRCIAQLPATPDTSPSSPPPPPVTCTTVADGTKTPLSAFGAMSMATWARVTDSESGAPPVFAGLPTPVNSPLSGCASVFDFSSPTSLWSAVLRHVDDATAVDELAAQLRQSVDDVAAATAPACSSTALTLRDLVCSGGPLFRPFAVTPPADDALPSPSYQSCHPAAASTPEFAVVSSFPPSAPPDQLYRCSTTISDSPGVEVDDVRTTAMTVEDLGEIDSEELDQYLSEETTKGRDDIALVVDLIVNSLSVVRSSSAASDATSVSDLSPLPPPFAAVKTEPSDPDFDRVSPSLVDAENSVAVVPDCRLSATSNFDELAAAAFDVAVTEVLNCGLRQADVVTSSTTVGKVDVFDSAMSPSSSCDSLESLISTCGSLSPTGDSPLPFSTDCSSLSSLSTCDGSGTYCPTWLSSVGQLPLFPTSSNQFVTPPPDMAAAAAVPEPTLPALTVVKQEIPDDVEFSCSTDDDRMSTMADCDFDDAALNCTDSTAIEDYDGTELLEVLADVPDA